MASISTETMTAEEFFEWVHRPENQDKFFELEQGEIVEMPLPKKYHGFVCGNVTGILSNFGIHRGKGYVCTNGSGVIVERDPDTVRGPDVTFYEDDQNASNMDRHYSSRPPKLAVEVLSPDDRVNKVLWKLMELLKMGVELVWVVDPESKDVSIHRPGKDPYTLKEDQELTGDDVLPGFHCQVAEFFSIPGQPTA